MDTSKLAAPSRTLAVVSLMTGATIWGLIWYPYRVLDAEGMNGIQSSCLTYAVAWSLGFCLWRKVLLRSRLSPVLIAIGLAAAACNLGFIAATLLGEVTRVMLLFYLSPLWTVLFARLLLGERLSAIGALVILISLSGAAVMLWKPEGGLPWPETAAEWLGLSAGIFFSLANVLIRKTPHLPIELKSMAVFSGVIVLSLVVWPFFPGTPWQVTPPSWGMLCLVGATLVFTNAIVQFALTHTPAAQAIVVMLFELVVAALASWLLAGETMGVQEWIGGVLIIGASLLSIRLEPTQPASTAPVQGDQAQ